jgi:NAD-dependent dihydropyrimidine dehydrogenase PreA subunit
MIPTVTVIANACTGCGICVESCPMDVLRLSPATVGKMIAYPKYGGDCEACLLCVIDCAREAIKVEMISFSERKNGQQV